MLVIGVCQVSAPPQLSYKPFTEFSVYLLAELRLLEGKKWFGYWLATYAYSNENI